MIRTPREIAETIVRIEQEKCRRDGSGGVWGCIMHVRDGDGGRAGGSLIDAIAAAIQAERVPALGNADDIRAALSDKEADHG